MPQRQVKLNDANEMPFIGFGSGTVNKGMDASSLILRAIHAGFTRIDTAQTYENEETVGKGIHASGIVREHLFVTTKYRSGVIQDSFRESLDKLGLSFVDLYLIHHPRFVAPDFEGSWKVLEKLKDDGLAKSIGVSNFNVEELQLMTKTTKIKPSVNQIEFHPYIYAHHKPLLEYCAENDIAVEGFSSLSSITTYRDGPVDPPVNAAAARHRITPAQVIFSWVKAKGVLIVTTSSNEARLAEYLAVDNLPPLTPEEIAAIDEAGAKSPIPGYTVAWHITPGIRPPPAPCS